jgi:hypothetical protein
MRLLSVFAQCFLTGALLIAQGQPTPDRSIQARNKAVAMRVFDEIFNQGNFQVADEIYAPDFRNHGLHRSLDLKTDQEAVHAEKKAFPDLRMSCGSPKLKYQCVGASETLSSRLGQHVTPNVVRIGRGLGSDWADPNRIEDGILPGLQPSLVPEGDSPPVARSSGDYVTVMQSTQSRQRGDLVRAWRHRRRNSTSGRVLPQPEMSPVFVVIADVFSQQASQVPLVQYDYVAEQIPTHTPNPALGDAILPGTAKSGSDGFCAVLFHGRDDSCRELRVPVED